MPETEFITSVLSERLPNPDTRRVPALIVVVPVYTLAPVNVTIPKPSFSMPPSPEITPEKVWSFSLPKFKKLPLVTSTLPVPSSVLIVSVDSMFSVASLLMTDV